MTNRTNGQLFRIVSVCFLALLGPGPVRGQGKELTPQERKELDSEAERLTQEAGARYRKGDYKGALRSFERALEVHERLHPGRDDPALAAALNNVGVALSALGRPGQALLYYERALAMRERLFPKQDHPKIAQSLTNLGLVLLEMRQPAKALPHFERALRILERLHRGQPHLHLAYRLTNVGQVLEALGERA